MDTVPSNTTVDESPINDCPDFPSQNFPDDLWKQIFTEAALPKLPLKELLEFRTVCKPWNRVICSFQKINSRGVPHLDFLQKLFDLRCLTIDASTDALPTFSLFTGLHTLKIDQPDTFLFHHDLSDLYLLTNLTKLMVSSFHITTLGPISDNLQFLYLKRPFAIREAEVQKLPNLKAYKTDATVRTFTGKLIHLLPAGRYEGYLKDGVRQGRGQYRYKNGDRYEGECLGIDAHGQGTYIWPSGAHYEGSFEKGLSHGYGVFTQKNGDRHEGEFFNDNMHGHGIDYFADGFKYEGNFKNDEKVGFGVLTFPGGERTEECYFKGGGHGIFFFDNGDRFECIYNDGQIDGPGTVYPKDGEKYDSQTYEGGGRGILFMAARGRVEGTFNCDLKLEGDAICYPAYSRPVEETFKEGVSRKVEWDEEEIVFSDLVPFYFPKRKEE